MKDSQKKIILVKITLVLINVFLYLSIYVSFGQTRVIDSLELNDGTQFVIATKHEGFVEFNVALFVKKKDQDKWGWFYIDHESLYWFHPLLKFDAEESIVSIYNNNKIVSTFHIKTEEHYLWNRLHSKGIRPEYKSISIW